MQTPQSSGGIVNHHISAALAHEAILDRTARRPRRLPSPAPVNARELTRPTGRGPFDRELR